MGIIIDVVILALVALMTFRGLRRGALSTLVSLASYGIAYLVATVVYKTMHVSLEASYGQVGLYVVILPAVFIVTLIAVRFAGKFLSGALNFTLAGPVNKLLGGALGFLKASIVVLAFVAIAIRLSSISGQWYLGSQVFGFLETIVG